MRSLCWKCNFGANFGVLPLGFDVKALIPQGFTGSPNYFGFLNNLMTGFLNNLIICESLREIGEVACVTSAWSSRGQTLNLIDPSESINFQGHNQPTLPFCSSKSCSPLKAGCFFLFLFFFLQGMSLEGTNHNAQIPFQNATLDSDEHFPFKG